MRRPVLAAVLFCALAAYGQQHPNDAQGFAPDKLYDFHDIDTINSFNGNLIIRIPIGPVFHANALISYQFTLVYNSHCWAYIDNSGNFTAYPQGDANAGLGWTLSLGRLISPTDPLSSNSNFWVYESPDGSQHTFYSDLHSSDTLGDAVGYTRDSTYLRMRKISDTERRIDLPDGTTRVFWLLEPNANLTPWQPSTAADAVWRLVQIVGPSSVANSVSITYTGSAQYNEIWTVKDGDRTSNVYFAPTGLSTMASVLDHIDLPAFGGSTATYTFTTSQVTVVPTPGGASPPVQGISGVPVVLLESVTLPMDQSGSRSVYSMLDAGAPAYDGYNTTGQSQTSGVLHKLTLPTQGIIHWDYQPARYTPPGTVAKSPAIDTPIVVLYRKTYQPGATTPDGTWQYDHQFGNVQCTINLNSYTFHRQLTTWVMRPLTGQDPQYATVSYFSVYDPNTDQCTVDPSEGWLGSEYGLPFTRYAKRLATDGDLVPLRYLSSQLVQGFAPPLTWDGHGSVSNATNAPTIISSSYLTYELDSDTSDNERDKNPRVDSVATVYDSDTGCGGAPCYTAANSYNFDGFGRYRQNSTVSNVPGNDTLRTDWLDSTAPNLDGVSLWLAGIWDKRCTTRDSTPRGAVDPSVPCSGLLVSGQPLLTAHAQFDSTTGLLTAKRTLFESGDTLSSSDLLATYDYDPEGYTSHERYFGGDAPPLAWNSEFVATSSPTYEIDYTPTFSSGGTLTARSGAYAVAGLSVLNETYDINTALVKTSTDPAGVETIYQYDARNRLLSSALQTSPASAPVNYAYTDASYGTVLTPATATVKRQSSTDGLIEQVYDYDAFGRLWHEERLLPSGMSVRQNVYTATGLKQQVSEFETTPTHYTVFSGFDPFDRPTVVTAPDGTQATYQYTGMRQVNRHSLIATVLNSPPTDQVTTELYDALHRLYQVSELNNTILTTYGYDTAGHLANVNIASGSASQTRTFSYDNRGFLQSEQHPENGTTNYGSYDARGHVGSKTVPGNTGCNSQSQQCFDLQYVYDQAERLTTVDSRDPNNPSGPFRPLKQFTYGNGQLETATRHNYQPIGDITVTETYQYDSGGRVSEKDTHIGPASSIDKTLKQSYVYDDVGLLSQIVYPQCYDSVGCATNANWGIVLPQYANGLLSGIAQPSFASGISYWPNGMVSTVSHANGVTDTYSLDPNGMARPASIAFSNWTTCAPPSISSQPVGGTITYNSSTTLSVAASGDSLTYQWYANGAPIAYQTSPSLTVTATQTTSYFVRIMNGCGRIDSNTVTVTVQLAAPTNLVATRTGANAITVTWQTSNGATSYQAWRRSGSSWIYVGSTSALSFVDSGVGSGATFIYYAVAAGNNVVSSGPSNNDLASTLSFTSVSPGMPVAYAQFNEILGGVNSVRAAMGDPPLQWADVLNPSVNGCAYGTVSTVPAPGAVIYGAHLMRLRCAMDNALIRAGITPSAYTDPDVTGMAIKAIHITDLQQRTY